MDFNVIRQNHKKSNKPQIPPPPNGYNHHPPPPHTNGGGGSSNFNYPPYTYEESERIRYNYRDAPPYVDSNHHQYHHPGGPHYGHPVGPLNHPVYHRYAPPPPRLLQPPPPPGYYGREPMYHERYYYPPPSYGGMFSDENPNACSIL